ncbi:GNAT family N-acetyltransferase [Methanolobus chelungpuianus]|uniref:GNAT family N-acetyltransferase n=1 Tax=Methanolobus chelungpuianus TaxID=502115 RepID=UPI002115B34B|nr:GNAT family N-acetyltransferase [Methanolobus chelungpuianus]
MKNLIWKVHMYMRQSLTASKLMVGSLITRHWVRITDKNVTNVSGEMLNEVLRLYNENFTEINEKRFTKYTRFFKKTTYVYTENNEVKGYCLYYIKPSLSIEGFQKTATLYSFTVDSRCRGQGIGAKLLQKSLLEMRLNSITSARLYVATDNTAAINLYRKVGFAVRREVMDICGPGKECYEMEIILDDRFRCDDEYQKNIFPDPQLITLLMNR